MLAILHSLGMFVADLFKPRCRLEAETLFLRHQLSIALRRAPPRLRLRGVDRALLVWITRLWPSLLGAAQVVQPETILRWHRAGFTVFWRWKSRKRAGRPKIDRELRDLIRRPSGWRDRSPRPFPGHQLPPTWCGTTTVPTDMPSRLGLGRWASATDRSRLDRRGKIRMWSV